MDKTPVKVYEDKGISKTPHSGVKRVLNITPASQPLSPKDVNVRTPLIFKPKKLQIPEIFSPISKIRHLQPRKKYTVSNDENCDNFGTDDEYTRDAVTSTPIVPKRNRNYTNFIKFTPRADRNVKILEKKGPISKVQNIKYSGKKNFTNGIDTYRRNNLKQNLTNELKAVLNKKQLRNESGRLGNESPVKATRDIRSQDRIKESNSFEELKARFEKVKSKAASAKSPPNDIRKKVFDSKQIVTKRNSPYSGNKLKLKPPCNQIIKDIETNISIGLESLETSGISILEGSTQESGSNLNYYTAFPDLTNLVSSNSTKCSDHLVSIDEHLKLHGQKQTDKNDISGIKIIPQSLNATSIEDNGTKNNPPPMSAPKEKNMSKIPKFNIETFNKQENRSILIRDEDIDRITYKMNLGPSRTLNSTSKERATNDGRNYTKLISESKKFNLQKEGPNYHKDDFKVKLSFQSSQDNKINKFNEIKDNAGMENMFTVTSCKKVQDSKSKSEPRKTTGSLKISRQNVSETDTLKTSKSNREISLSYNTRKRIMRTLGKITRSEVQNTDFKITSECIVTTSGNKTSQEYKDLSIQKPSSNNETKSIGETAETFNSLDKNFSDEKDNEKPLFPLSLSEDQCPVNSTFVIQNSNSRHCYCSISKRNSSCPHDSISSCRAKHISKTRDNSVKSSLETLGECFKFRRKNTLLCIGNKTNLKRSYSFVHVSVKGSNYDPKPLLDIYSLSKSFPKESYSSTGTESSPIDPNAYFPKRSHKRRKQLRNLTTEHPLFRENLKEGRTETLKGSEEIFDERGNKDPPVDVHNEPPHRPCSQDSEDQESIDICAVSTDLPNIYDATSSELEPDSLNQIQETDHKQKIISFQLEKDELTEESDDCVILNDEFFKKTNRMINNENELKEISKGVERVENDLVNLSKLHAEIKEDLVIKWACPKSLKSSSSSDNVSEGNVSVKDKDDFDSCIPLRNAASVKQTGNLNVSKLSLGPNYKIKLLF